MMTCRCSGRGALTLAIVALAAAVALAMPALARPAAAYAAPAGPPTVVYDSAAREFSVRNADGGSLFDTLENLVPGDSSSHTVAVRVENARTPVALYLRPSCDRAIADVIGPVRVVMSVDGRTLYDGEIGELLREGALPVKMAELSGGRSADFTLDVVVPVTLAPVVRAAREPWKPTFRRSPKPAISPMPLRRWRRPSARPPCWQRCSSVPAAVPGRAAPSLSRAPFFCGFRLPPSAWRRV